MQFRKLGWTDLELSTIGLGTWAIGGTGWQFGWGPQDDAQSIATILQAMESGLNWIDTAPVYGMGHSEEVVGQALKQMSSRPIVATKCGRNWSPEGNLIPHLKRERIRQEIEDSLRRLDVEVIDLYQMHWPQPDEDVEEAWSTMAEFVKEGKVRYIGVSNFNVEQLKRAQAIHPIASLQPPYSMLRREIEMEVLPFCAEHNIGVVAYSPMQKGLLTGRITPERMQSLPADDHRHGDVMFQEPQLSLNLKLVDGLRQIAEAHGKTPAHVAIAWTLRRPELTAAIVGARTPAQIAETAQAGDLTLSPEEVARIDTWLAEREAALAG